LPSHAIYSGLRLPLSDDVETVDKILCLANFEKDIRDINNFLQNLIEENREVPVR